MFNYKNYLAINALHPYELTYYYVNSFGHCESGTIVFVGIAGFYNAMKYLNHLKANVYGRKFLNCKISKAVIFS